MRGVFLLLGTNLGHREQNLRTALARLEAGVGAVEAVSSTYETSAWGIEEQPDFLNLAIKLRTELSPEEVLTAILKIEKGMGRERIVKWGTRLIDIDILFYHDQIIDLPHLVVPHPEFRKRKFALAPMAEIAAHETYPGSDDTISALHATCTDQLPVRLYSSNGIAAGG